MSALTYRMAPAPIRNRGFRPAAPGQGELTPSAARPPRLTMPVLGLDVMRADVWFWTRFSVSSVKNTHKAGTGNSRKLSAAQHQGRMKIPPAHAHELFPYRQYSVGRNRPHKHD